MDYDASLRWLLTLPDFERTGQFSARPDLAPMRALLAALGDPQRGRPTLHVAGSKGKGSTAAMADAILHACGRHTGCYISPHLHRFNERVRIDGAPVSPERFAAAMTAAHDAMAAVAPRFPGREFVAFDALTAAAFVAFRDAGIDAQVVEVGLGGLLDSTNVFQRVDGAAREPHVSVITSISLEHTAVLGSTAGAIAAQKAGIIARDDVVVVAPMRESALDAVRTRAAEQGARAVEVARACQMARTTAGAEGQDFRLKTPRETYAAHLPLIGRHQLDNAATAVVACEELCAQAGIELTRSHVRSGLADVAWPGRLEVLKRRPLVVVDGAHNGDSAKRMAAALREDLGLPHALFLVGTLSDKDAGGMAEAVAPMAEQVLVPSWPNRRAADPAVVASAFRALDVPVAVFGSLPAACDAVLAEAGERGAVVAFGAISFAAAVREYLLGIQSDMIRLQSGAAPAGQGARAE
ncbi:MAG: bifunctional folylpolyglutamate synthase/dihydrofolate synthase [Dehalococcoidia bacterium]